MHGTFNLPYLTAALPGTGGRVKESPEDFFVEEHPLYEASGEGEHLFIRIEKRGISTFDAVRTLARALSVAPRDIGYAGLKDASAVARQTLSVSGVAESKVRGVSLPGITIVDVRRHSNKLRIGHLKGNSFRITIRGVEPNALEKTRAILEALTSRGVPNFYGPQRMGVLGRNVAVGKAILRRRWRRAVQAFFAPCSAEAGGSVHEARSMAWRGDYGGSLSRFPEGFVSERSVAAAMRKEGLAVRGGEVDERRVIRAIGSVPRRLIEFYVSALQAHLFNDVLRGRFDTFDTLLDGDLAWIHAKGAVFLVTDPAAEAPRARTFEVSPSGPIYGTTMRFAQGVPGTIEKGVLEKAHLSTGSFRSPLGINSKGARRPLRVPLGEVFAEPSSADSLTVGFFLPKGAFATTVLREIMKPAAPTPAPPVECAE